MSRIVANGMKKVFSYLILIGSAAAFGIGAGFAGKKLFGDPEVDFGDLDMNALRVDAQAIVNKVDAYNGPKDKTEVFTASEILNYSLEKFRTCENCCSFTFGYADTIVKQDIRGCSIKNGDKYFEESVSKSSMVALANRMVQNGKDGGISLYSGSKGSVEISESSTSAEYSSSSLKEFTGEEYKNTYGKTLDEMFIYLICDETINSSTIDKTSSGYTITVDLDKDLSTMNYKVQMKNISGLDKLPTFQNVNLTFQLDSDLRLQKLSIDENYVATMMVDAKTRGVVDIYYYSDVYIKIPELNEFVDYKKGV